MVSKSLKDLDLKSVYRSSNDDIFNDFYKKCLDISITYSRAVGYFSSEVLAMSAQGLSNLIRSDGSMRLIIGHPLSDEEFEAVKHGIQLGSIHNKLSEKLLEMLTNVGPTTERLELLAWLIACKKLEIKFSLRRAGMYHEKIGIFKDICGNSVVFSGSANETPSGLIPTLNAESISVYESWHNEIYERFGKVYEDGFEKLWNNQEESSLTIAVPSEIYDKISSAVAEKRDLISHIVEHEETYFSSKTDSKINLPSIPVFLGKNKFEIFKHQRRALENWRANGYRGIMKLATGSGKTITAIYGAVKIFEAHKKKEKGLCLVVAVPYIELAIQWVENLSTFSIIPIQCFESSSSWYERLENTINYFNSGVLPFFAVVVVNKTMTAPHFHSLIAKVDQTSLIVVGDECHNHGSKNINESLPDAYYRIGLSATPFRSDDDEIDSPFPNDAKERLETYYGSIVAEYSLGDAILDGVLTPYEYHIIPVYLDSEEQDKYDEMSLKISKLLAKQKSQRLDKQDRELLTSLCGKRSRLIGSAKGKLSKLAELTRFIDSIDRPHTLFYAGEGKPYSDDAQEDVKVIDQVSEVLSSNGWRISQFTGSVSRQNRKRIMESFKDKTIDALVAMKVLDEGIDVPACQTAFILASTRNPRQYVQRRGRILRRYAGKSIAKIYDFVVLPINNGPAARKLKEAEAERINDFALLATNKMDIENIIKEYGLTYDLI